MYSGRIKPLPSKDEQPSRGEDGLQPTAIRINPDEKDDKLDPMSRLNLGTPFTIDHYVKVKSYGHVHPDSKLSLQMQLRALWAAIFGDTPAILPERPLSRTLGTQAPKPANVSTGASETWARMLDSIKASGRFSDEQILSAISYASHDLNACLGAKSSPAGRKNGTKASNSRQELVKSSHLPAD